MAPVYAARPREKFHTTMHLTTADLHLLLDVVELLRSPSRLSLVDRPDAVQKLASLLHADFVGHVIWNQRVNRFEQASHWGRDVQMGVDYEQYFQFIDPISPLLCGRQDPIPSDTVVDRKTLRKTEYFGDFMSHYRSYSGIDLYLHDAGEIQFDYRFWTSDPKKRFGEREISLLNVLRPHLINQYHLRLVEQSRSQPDTSTGGCPGFLLQESGSPKPNHKARKLLAGLEQGDRDTLYRLLSQIRHDSSAVLQWNGFNLCVEYAAHAGNRRPVYAVHLLAHTIGSGAWLQQRFDLTLREGEVCHLLLEGMADKQIAAVLNISYWTVRRHVGHVLEKLGVDSRSAIGLAVLNASHKARFD